VMPPQTPIDLNVTAHAAAINSNGSLIVAVPTAEGPRVYICAPGGSVARERCEEKGPLVPWFASAVDVSPAGDRVAVAGREGNIEIVSPAGTPVMAPFAAQFSTVSIAWHPQREWLAVGGDDGGLVVLDLVRHAEVFRRSAGRGVVSAVAWRPDGSELAFVCEDMAVCIAHVRPDGTLERESDFVRLNGHGNRITRVAWALDGRHLATADAGHDIMVWGLDPDRRVTFDLPLSDGVRAMTIAFSPIGRLLAAARDDGDVSLWDAATLVASETRGATGEARRLRVAAKKPAALAWSPDGSLSLGYEDASVALWRPDLASQPRLGQLPAAPSQLAFTSDGTRLAALSADGRVHLVEVARIDPRAAVALGAPPSGAPARALAAHPGQGGLSVSYEGGQIAVWDLATRKIIGLMPVVDPIAALSLSASPDGHLLAATGGDAFVEVYDLDTRKVWDRLEIQAEETGGFVAFSHDGKRLAAIGADDRVYVWQLGKAVEPFVTIDIDSSSSPRARMTSGQYAGGLAWLGPNQLAVLTALGVIRIVNLDVADWQSRAAKLHFESSAPNVRP
jgi:WD40 repeat protein